VNLSVICVIYKIFLESLCEVLRKDYKNLVVTSLNVPALCNGFCQTGKSSTKHCGDGESSDMQERDASQGGDAISPSCQRSQAMESREQCKLGRCYTLFAPIEQYSIFYIGSEGRTLSNIIINYHACQVRNTCINAPVCTS